MKERLRDVENGMRNSNTSNRSSRKQEKGKWIFFYVQKRKQEVMFQRETGQEFLRTYESEVLNCGVGEDS